MRKLLLFSLICWATVCFCSENAFSGMVYGVGSSENQGIYTIDTQTQQTTEILSTPGISWYGATDGPAGSFYATSNDGALYRVDISLNQIFSVGQYGEAAINGLAYNDSTGILYGTDSSSLYSINTSTGVASLIGSMGGLDSVWAFDYVTSSDQLLGVNNADQSLYSIDMATGSASLIGATGQSRITDIWYDDESGLLYGIGTYPHQMYQIDPATGQATLTGQIAPAITGLGTPVPEPLTLGYVLLGFLAIRRKNSH